jgi:hypothetical protein
MMRSPAVMHRSGSFLLEEATADFDPLPALENVGDRLYLVGQLAPRYPERARRLAHSFAEPATRKAALALVGLRTAAGADAIGLLEESLALDPDQPAARAALVTLGREAPPPARPTELLLRAARRSAAGGPGELRMLEPRLAAVDAQDPLHRRIARFRARWRIASGEAALAAEAIEILDRGQAGNRSFEDVLERARAAAVAGNEVALLASLDLALKGSPPARPAARLAREGRELIERTASTPEWSAWRSSVLEELSKLAPAGS